mmetsp:Transcript_6915/g.12714  ORF Transcript_6915/g.12714 Transcript_6915/m.12714 type:complete len:530 (-) Transcript_6915:151-1740(-)
MSARIRNDNQNHAHNTVEKLLLDTLQSGYQTAREWVGRRINTGEAFRFDSLTSLVATGRQARDESYRLRSLQINQAVAAFTQLAKVDFKCKLPPGFSRNSGRRSQSWGGGSGLGTPTEVSTPTETRERKFRAKTLGDFEREFQEYSMSISDDPRSGSKLINGFLSNIYTILLRSESSPTFGSTSDSRSGVLYVAEYLFSRLYRLILPIEKLWLDDNLLHFKMIQLQKITPYDLGLAGMPSVQESPQTWRQALDMMRLLDLCYSPLSKVQCMARCFKCAVDVMRVVNPSQSLDADTCLSVLVYVLIQAPNRLLLAHIKFVEWYSGNYQSPTDVLPGEMGYCYTQFVIAIQYLSGNEILGRAEKLKKDKDKTKTDDATTAGSTASNDLKGGGGKARRGAGGKTKSPGDPKAKSHHVSKEKNKHHPHVHKVQASSSTVASGSRSGGSITSKTTAVTASTSMGSYINKPSFERARKESVARHDVDGDVDDDELLASGAAGAVGSYDGPLFVRTPEPTKMIGDYDSQFVDSTEF